MISFDQVKELLKPYAVESLRASLTAMMPIAREQRKTTLFRFLKVLVSKGKGHNVTSFVYLAETAMMEGREAKYWEQIQGCLGDVLELWQLFIKSKQAMEANKTEKMSV